MKPSGSGGLNRDLGTGFRGAPAFNPPLLYGFILTVTFFNKLQIISLLSAMIELIMAVINQVLKNQNSFFLWERTI
jgi:hypothetical protein